MCLFRLRTCSILIIQLQGNNPCDWAVKPFVVGRNTSWSETWHKGSSEGAVVERSSFRRELYLKCYSLELQWKKTILSYAYKSHVKNSALELYGIRHTPIRLLPTAPTVGLTSLIWFSLTTEHIITNSCPREAGVIYHFSHHKSWSMRQWKGTCCCYEKEKLLFDQSEPNA